MLDEFVQAIAVFVALTLYFLPAIIADHRKRRDLLVIALFNACLGWTGIGWLIAFYWAMLPNPPAGLVHEVMTKRRTMSMRAFSQGLAARIERRAARRRVDR